MVHLGILQDSRDLALIGTEIELLGQWWVAGTVAAGFHGGEQSSTGAEERRRCSQTGGAEERLNELRLRLLGATWNKRQEISAFPIKTKGQPNIIARWS